MISDAWAESTHKAYSFKILAYHVHCDKRNIPEHLQALISNPLATSFITSPARSYSGSTISNYLDRVHAWHILHGLPWRLNLLELDALLRGVKHLTPASSKMKKLLTYTPNLLASIHSHLCLNIPFDAAVWASYCMFSCSSTSW